MKTFTGTRPAGAPHGNRPRLLSVGVTQSVCGQRSCDHRNPRVAAAAAEKLSLPRRGRKVKRNPVRLLRAAAGGGVAAGGEVVAAEVARGVAGEKHLPAYSRLSRKPKKNEGQQKAARANAKGSHKLVDLLMPKQVEMQIQTMLMSGALHGARNSGLQTPQS